MARGKGQAWSMDLVIGLVIFMIAIGVTYSLLGNLRQENPAPLRIESEVVATKLTTDGNLKVADENQLNMDSLAGLATRDYESLKQDLGVSEEFCIYLQDDEGNLVYIQDTSGNTYAGIGSGGTDVQLSGHNCGELIT